MVKIIPCLDTRDGKLVKGVNFVDVQELGSPVEFAELYEREGADELVLLDISKTTAGHHFKLDLIQEISSEITMPLTVGGGIASTADAREVLEAGADKVSVNSAAIKNPDLIDQVAKEFGSQALVLAVDVSYDKDLADYYIYTKGGQEQEDIKALDWIKEAEERGAGSLLITSIDHDGMKQGFDLPFLKDAASKVDIPIIASGGAGGIDHFVNLFKETDVQAGLAASIFHKREVSISELKARLKAERIDLN